MNLNKSQDQYRSFCRGSMFRGVLLIATLLAALAVSTQAQSFTGSISGTISDPAGAVIPGATITLTAVETGQTRTATTSNTGEYNFASLPPGSYKLRITAPSFTAGEITAQLAVSQELRADAQLKIGAESESVQISAGEGGVAVSPVPRLIDAQPSHIWWVSVR